MCRRNIGIETNSPLIGRRRVLKSCLPNQLIREIKPRFRVGGIRINASAQIRNYRRLVEAVYRLIHDRLRFKARSDSGSIRPSVTGSGTAAASIEGSAAGGEE